MWILAISIVLLALIIFLVVVDTRVAPGRKPAVANCSQCNQCNQMPCQCSQVLPGQTQCPMCPGGSIVPTNASGIVGCGGCQRAYRCPGCLLGANATGGVL